MTLFSILKKQSAECRVPSAELSAECGVRSAECGVPECGEVPSAEWFRGGVPGVRSRVRSGSEWLRSLFFFFFFFFFFEIPTRGHDSVECIRLLYHSTVPPY